MNLFIDTNVFLDFFHLSGPDIEELNKLTALLEEGAIKLFVPHQLCDEFKRNRDGKIKSAMDEFQKIQLKISFPAFCKLYSEYSELQDILKSANVKHDELFKKAMADVNAVALKADGVIADLFGKASIIATTLIISNRALMRFRMGNPPGKKKATMGDEVNWESLLEGVPNDEDLHLVSGDGDYAASIDREKFNVFLNDEWREKKNSSIFFYRSLQDFFKSNYPSIKLASDVKKTGLINRLAQSVSFATTHLMIAKLQEIDDFSPAQVEELIQIAQFNSQVGWILGDEDVSSFYKKLKEKYQQALPAGALAALNELLAETDVLEEEEEIPF